MYNVSLTVPNAIVIAPYILQISSKRKYKHVVYTHECGERLPIGVQFFMFEASWKPEKQLQL